LADVAEGERAQEHTPNVDGARSEEGFGVFRQGTRPSRDEVIRYIDEHKDRFGVEAICRILRPAPLRVAGTVKPVPAVCSTGPDAGAAASRA
jgi:hypothetical protein